MAKFLPFFFFIILLVADGCSPSNVNSFYVPSQSGTGLHGLSTPSPTEMTKPPDLSPTLSQTPSLTSRPLTSLVGSVFDSGNKYAGQMVEIIGYFHGWDLLHEMQSGPPMTRSDWVIADNSGAIYVTGMLPPGLDPSSRADTGTILDLNATVRSSQTGQVYLECQSVDLLNP